MTSSTSRRSTLVAIGAAVATGALLWGILTVACSAGCPQRYRWAGRPVPHLGMAHARRRRRHPLLGPHHHAGAAQRGRPVDASASREQAASIAAGLRFGELAPGEPRISLRYATRRFSADKMDGGFDHRLVWILEYANSPIMLIGPPNLPEADRQAMEQNAACDFIIAIYARTGETVASLQTCRKAPST